MGLLLCAFGKKGGRTKEREYGVSEEGVTEISENGGEQRKRSHNRDCSGGEK